MSKSIQSPRAVRFGSFELDLSSGELRKNGIRIRLPEQPFRVLQLLLQRPGEVITREELRQQLWPADTFVDFETGLNSAVKKLRDILGDSAEEPHFVETIPRRGYRFIYPVDESPAVAEVPQPVPRGHRIWIAVLISSVVIFVLFGLRLADRGSEPTAAGAVQTTLAVLPFGNTGAGADRDYLRMALADEVALTLSYAPSLSIRPMAATRKFAEESDPQAAGRALKVSNVVTGQFSHEGENLRVSLEVIDVEENRLIWRDAVSVPAGDLPSVREQVTSRIRYGMLPVLGVTAGSLRAFARPNNPQAYELYLRATALPTDAAPSRVAVEMLERAVQLDPDFAPAWAALGRRYMFLVGYGGGGKTAYGRSEAATSRALALDPELAEARDLHIQRFAEKGEWRTAYDLAIDFVRKQPERAQAHFTLAYVFRYAGLLDEAMAECEAASQRDPRDSRHRTCNIPFELAGKYDRALDFVRLDSGSQWAAGAMSEIYMRQGKLKAARETAEPVFSPSGRACHEGRPRPEIQKLWAGEAVAVFSLPDPEPKYFRAALLATCDMADEAFRLLRNVIESNYCAYPALDNDPLWDKVRSAPEFNQIRAQAIACRDRALTHMRQRGR